MTAPQFLPCLCSHTRAEHQHPELRPQCAAEHCECIAYRPIRRDASGAVIMPQTAPSSKRCTNCATVKASTDFYTGNTQCKDCSNSRKRVRPASKFIRGRARNRATAELIRRHADEFSALLELYTSEATQEAARLAMAVAATDVYAPTDTVRLRPGKRREGQALEDRIDVARCPECVGHHDRGHVCLACGARPEHAVAS